MSERTIRRSVWFSVAAALGLMGSSYRAADNALSQLDTNKRSRSRNNYHQKADARVLKVQRWRKRNKIAARSRAVNRR